MFIVIEGADGVGKATQAKLLVERFERSGRRAVGMSFPRYDTPLGQLIKHHLQRQATDVEDAMVLQCLLTTDRYTAIGEIMESLRGGAVVVTDRWWPSGYAYGLADGLPSWLLRGAQRLPPADVNVLLEIPLEEARRRRPELRDRYEQDADKQLSVRQHYRDLWENDGLPDVFVIVDGVGSAAEVHERIWKQVGGRGF